MLQREDVDDALRNGLWEACTECYLFSDQQFTRNDNRIEAIVNALYVDFFKRSSDNIDIFWTTELKTIRAWFFKANWFEVYNFVEFLAGLWNENARKRFVARANFFLEREKSAYRFLDGRLAAITDPAELAAIAEAIGVHDKFEGAREHLNSAIGHFSAKPEPDYRNAIKEAISAVESVTKVISGKKEATLGDALKSLDGKKQLHPALRDGLLKIYGYTSAEGGIRHAMLEVKEVDEADAKFMIVICAAFVNLCVQRLG